MENTNQFDWVLFYQEFAEKLQTYKNRRKELCEMVPKIFDLAHLEMPKMEEGNVLKDIDPFSVFGIFNKSSMKKTNRTALISAVKELFNVLTAVPTSFDSIPVLNNINATYYYYGNERGEHDIDELWELYDAALAYAKHPAPENKERVVKYFDLAIKKPGIGNSKLTMGLYWIAPDTFLNLDSRNVLYIYESGQIPKEITQNLPTIDPKVSGNRYFEIIDAIKEYLQSGSGNLRDFKQLSFAAWQYSEKVNREKRPGVDSDTAIGDEQIRNLHYWLYSPGDGADHWDEFYKAGIMAIGWIKLGDLSEFCSKNEIKQKLKECYDPEKSYTNDALTTWQFANEMQPGDIVFAKKGRKTIIGRGIVQSDYIYEPERESYPNVRKVEWTHNEEKPYSGNAPMKTLTDMTDYTEYVEKLEALFEEEPSQEREQQYEKYDKDAFLKEVYMNDKDYDKLVRLVVKKKNLIIQGAPGVGKTFAAKRLAYSIIGAKNQDCVMMVQFHQSYSYEDFIMGFRPNVGPDGKEFELRNGVFYDFCKKAELDSENNYFFIIDEINRGNLSKIFGELFMLIENDKRGIKLRLLYSNEQFSVPKNVYIIGLMNTADRSLAMLDYALRRRFAFFELAPGFDSEGFIKYRQGLKSNAFDRLIDCVTQLNAAIAEDSSLGDGFRIGHSYFCNLKEATKELLSDIIETELIPLLREYWFDEPQKVGEWSEKLRKSIQ